MARKVLNMSTIKEIRRLKELNLSERAIARALKIHRNTVKKYLLEDLPLATAADESEATWQSQLDWQELRGEAERGVPLQVLWEEQHEAGRVPVLYPAFWKQLRKRFPTLEKSMHRVFAPGSRCEIDYCDGIDILDPITGELRSTELFVGVLCGSRYAFAEFTWSQKSEDFLTSHVHIRTFPGKGHSNS
jgi:transposase